MPKLWTDTVEAHRHEVRGAIMAAALALATERGPLNVTMSQVAERAGIGRATLYRYFTGVDEILRTWHGERVAAHVAELTDLAEADLPPWQRLASVLTAYAGMRRREHAHASDGHGGDLVAVLHGGAHVAEAERGLRALLASLLAQAAASGEVRGDLDAEELAAYCLHALEAAHGTASEVAAARLVVVVLDGLRANPRLVTTSDGESSKG